MTVQRFNQRKGLAMFAWLGLLFCLVSASIIHHHQDGVHLLHACQLCNLEDITTHGSAVSLITLPLMGQNIESEDSVLYSLPIPRRYAIIDIRGSPAIS